MKFEKGRIEENEVKEEEMVKQNLLSKAQISVLLSGYNDIFNSFDPRPFINRSLSDDFLINAKNAALDKEEGVLELSFMIPKKERNFEHELVIKKRLREHFKKHTFLLEKEVKRIKKTGIYLALAGLLMLVVATILTFYNQNRGLLFNLLLIILEPSGWFMFWIGGEKIVYEARNKSPDLEFYRKMTKVEITFHGY